MTHKLDIKAIIFDHDGTLVDSEPVHHSIWSSTLSPFGIHLPRHTYQTELSGKPTIQSAQRLVAEHNLQIDAQTLCNTKINAIKEYLTHSAFPMMPGVAELMTWLTGQHFALAVASGASNHEVSHSLSTHNLSAQLNTVTTKDDVQNNKPAPDVYLHAANQLGHAPQHCLAVEDSDSGQTSAIDAGMYCLRINTHTTLPAHPRCFTIDSIASMQSWLQQNTQ